MKVLVVDPLEPLSLSRAEMAGKDLLSIHSTPLTVPLPTTVLGMLGAVLGVWIDSKVFDIYSLNDIEAVESHIRSLCKCCLNPLILGPLVSDSRRVYVPFPPLFVPLDELDLVLKKHKTCGEYYLDIKACNYCISCEGETMIGITLDRRAGKVDGAKTVRPGHMYRYQLTVCRRLNGEPVAYKYLYIVNCENIDVKGLARFGGEGRIAEVYVEDVDRYKNVLTRVKSPLQDLEAGLYLALSYIPLLPREKEVTSLSIHEFYGLEFVEKEWDIIGIPQPDLRSPKVRVEKLGLGFSEIAKSRRPMILALPPGTLVRIRSKKGAREPNRLLRLLWNIGFASLYYVGDIDV